MTANKHEKASMNRGCPINDVKADTTPERFSMATFDINREVLRPVANINAEG